MPVVDYTIKDVGAERVLTIKGEDYRTYYTERIIRMLIDRKGLHRAPLYLPFKETRGRRFLQRLFTYLAAQGARDLRALEVGCSSGHITEYLDEQPVVAEIYTFDVDLPFVEIARTKVEELGLGKVRQVLHLTDEETTRLPFADASFDLVLAVGVVEHLRPHGRHRYVDEYYRVLAPNGHIAVLETPNRAFPLERHSVGLPGIQWLPPQVAFHYARLLRPDRVRGVSFEEFDGGAWRNASLAECLPSDWQSSLVDVTEEAGYGWRFYRESERSPIKRAALPIFALLCAALRVLNRPPSLALPYFNLVFRKKV